MSANAARFLEARLVARSSGETVASGRVVSSPFAAAPASVKPVAATAGDVIFVVVVSEVLPAGRAEGAACDAVPPSVSATGLGAGRLAERAVSRAVAVYAALASVYEAMSVYSGKG